MTSNMWAALVSGGLVEQLGVSGGRAEITQRFLEGLAGGERGGGVMMRRWGGGRVVQFPGDSWPRNCGMGSI